MTTEVDKFPKKLDTPGGKSLELMLPPGSAIQQIAFVAEKPANHTMLLEFPHPIQRWAMLVTGEPGPASTWVWDFAILAIPAESHDTTQETESPFALAMQTWVDAGHHVDRAPSLVMTFQGAQLCWNPGRVAILAKPDRLEAVRNALIEVLYYEAELRDIERTVGETWPQLESDAPLAFEFEERSIQKRKQLRQRFQQVLLIRARLARIGPSIHGPHLHPPTLASQIGERFRERTRMLHRHEFLGQQIEVFERIYEMCGQRASDFMLARTGHTLEWIIIVCLVTQTLFWLFELLTGMRR